MKMNKRLHTKMARFFVGYLISLLAVVLLALTPMLKAIHFSSCPHNHNYLCVNHDSDKDHGSVANPLKHLGTADVTLRSSDRYTSDNCPVCQALQTLGKHFTLPGQPVYPLPTAALVSSFPRYHAPLFLFFKSSLRSRAPPLF